MERLKIIKGEKEGRIPSVFDQESSDSGIHPIIKKGDVLLFDFSAESEDGKRVLLFSVKRKGERVLLRNDDKMFLGVFSDKDETKSRVMELIMELIILLETILGVRMSLSFKKEMVIAVIS